MPSRPDLSFAGLDDSVYKTNVSETITSVPRNESTTSKSSKDNLEQPKDVRPSAPIIEEEVRPVWNNTQRVNHQNTLSHPHSKRNFVPVAVLTKSRQLPVNTAKQSFPRAAVSNSTVRYVNTIASRPTVNVAKPSSNVFNKSHSPVRRPKAVVSAAKENEDNAVKSLACWIWRPKGNVINHISKDSGSYTPKIFDYVDPQGRLKSDQGIFDSGCSRHMIGNKFYLSDYQDIDGGFVAFAGSPKGGKITGKARTMLADSLLPATFWAEAVNTACYVQNRVLVTKPYNKTPYELLLGRPPSISFMRPFGCLVTFLNTLDPLGKFDEKANEGFLVGYSVNSKAFRVFNTRTKKVEENMHIKFLENKPNVAGSGPEWLFDIDSLTKSINYEPVTAGNQTNDDAGIETNVQRAEMMSLLMMLERRMMFSIQQKTVIKMVIKKMLEIKKKLLENNLIKKLKDWLVKERLLSLTALTDLILLVHLLVLLGKVLTIMIFQLILLCLIEISTGIFRGAYDDEDVGAEADLNNLETTMNVSPIPTTRIHKDHPKDQIIGDINSAIQTRRMINFSEENAMVSYISKQRRTNHKDYQNCLFAYFLSQIEPKKVIQALTDPSWIEAMQEELLQFKLQKTTSTPTETNKALIKDEEAENVDVHWIISNELGLELKGQTALVKNSQIPLMAGQYCQKLKYRKVAVLEKSDENAEFHQIVDFLSTCSINYALIAVVISESSVRNDLLFDDEDGITCLTNDDIFENLALMGNLDPKKFLMYLRFLQLFLNNQLTDLPEPFNDTYETPSHTKKVSLNMARQSKSFSGKVTPLFESMLVQNQAPKGESSIPMNLKLRSNIEQILPSPSIYQRKHSKTQKHRRAKKVTELPQTSVSLNLGADEDVHKEGVTGIDTGGSPKRQETMGGTLAQTRSERVLKQPNEPPLPEGHTSKSEEGRMAHTFELMDIVPPTPHDSPLPGGYTPGSNEGRLTLEELMAMCTKLSKQVLDLEKEKDAQAVEILKLKKRVKKLERQRKSSILHPRKRIYKQVESSDDDLDEEDASKHGRKSDNTNPMFKDSDFDGLDDDMENIEGEIVYAATSGVSTAGALVSTARPTVVLRQAIYKCCWDFNRPTSVVITDTEQEQRRLTTPPSSQPLDTRDKGKEYDTIQTSIDADALFAARLQQEEREQFTIEERAQFLVETITTQRKFRAAQRAAEIRSKSPTKTQLRNMMRIHILKNMGKERQRKKRVADSSLKQKSSKKQKMMQEQESAKSDEDAAADYEHEKEELRMWLTVVPDEEETVDPEILSAKYPNSDWEISKLLGGVWGGFIGNVDMEDLHVYKTIRADGNTSYHKSLFSMLRKFDRQDLVDLHRLVMKRFKDNTLEGYNLLLWGDLKVMFKPNAKDEIWSKSTDWTLLGSCDTEMLEKMLNWKLEAEAESTMAFELLKFIKSQLED
ncbi:retrovirus-related pol polyprotein from transposon TNT 1-94 [Tanacetum coccineum]